MFNSKNFRTKLENDLRKFDSNNTEFQTFDNTFLFVLNENVPFKLKHLRANNTSFITKDMGKAIMKRLQLRNQFLKHKIEPSRSLYNKLRNV